MFSADKLSVRLSTGVVIAGMSALALSLSGCGDTVTCDTTHVLHISDGDMGEQTYWGYANKIAPKANSDQQQAIVTQLEELNGQETADVELGAKIKMLPKGSCGLS